jgi:hypothetical protein
VRVTSPSTFIFSRDLSHVSAKEAGRFGYRAAVVEFVLEVADIGLGPGLT